jgi:hypothetical protein
MKLCCQLIKTILFSIPLELSAARSWETEVARIGGNIMILPKNTATQSPQVTLQCYMMKPFQPEARRQCEWNVPSVNLVLPEPQRLSYYAVSGTWSVLLHLLDQLI